MWRRTCSLALAARIGAAIAAFVSTIKYQFIHKMLRPFCPLPDIEPERRSGARCIENFRNYYTFIRSRTRTDADAGEECHVRIAQTFNVHSIRSSLSLHFGRSFCPARSPELRLIAFSSLRSAVECTRHMAATTLASPLPRRTC